jgi:energy-coupling factor transport system permease protein
MAPAESPRSGRALEAKSVPPGAAVHTPQTEPMPPRTAAPPSETRPKSAQRVSAEARPYLRRRNPTVKFGAALALSLLLTLVVDPETPLLFLVGTVIAGLALGRVPAGTYARALVPLLLVAAGFVWSNALFAAAPDSAGVLVHWGPIRVSTPGLLFGLGIALRGLAIGALSLTFILTTDPTDLVVSLIRHGRLPWRIGYSLLAGVRFLPFFAQEYEQVRLAQRVRGRVEHASPLARLRRHAAYVLPLLATAVRRASRVAVAMDARGFAAATRRTYYREVPIDWSDAAFALGTAAWALALLALSRWAGWLRLWDGRFSA